MPAIDPDAQQRKRRGAPPAMPAEWLAEAEASLRAAARALEVVGLTSPEAARSALIAYRLASRVRSDRLGLVR